MKKVSIFIFITVLFFGIFLLWWNNGNSPVNKNDRSQKIFIVAKGAGIKEIANNLKEQGLIKDTVVFFLVVKKEGLEGKIQAGDFRLSPSMNTSEIAENLTHGTLDIWVTIPEGYRADQIADLLSKSFSTYKSQWREELRNNEGYLFPDTYLIPKDTDIESIISILRNNFEKQYASIPNNNKYTKNQLVTIASLVEREAKHPQDRPLVASVIENRLDIGMGLQIDATVQFALANARCQAFADTRECTWWPKNLTLEDLKISSIYNTYRNTGLPPTPIANPGIEALKAAANPANTDYIYYITDRNGINRYGRTLEEHNANIQRYGL